MNRSSLAFSLACFAVFASGAHARADTQSKNDETQLQASDFAYGMQLEPTPGQALQTFVLPHEVLEHLSVQRAELVVTNRIGERVPHAVRQLRASDQERRRERTVPFFPLYQDRDVRPGAPSRVHVQVQRGNDGRLVRVDLDERENGVDNAGRTDEATEGTARTIAAYLLDTTQVGPVERLRFQLTGHEPTFVWPVALETSRDLTHFSPTSVRGSLLSLRHGEHDVQLQHLDLFGLDAKYVRLSWSTAAPPATIEAVTAELMPEQTTPPLTVQHVQGAPDPTSPNHWLFDLGAALPIAKLELIMSEPNTVIEAELEARLHAESPFYPLYRGTFYRLEHAGTALQSTAVDVTPQYQRYVRVRVASRGGGLGSGRLELRAHVIPEQLLFVAKGEGPFSLAFGHYGASISAFDEAQLLELVGTAASELAATSITAGPIVELAGPSALTPPPPTTNYAKWALWSILGAAVLLLAALSYTLFRRVNAPTSTH